MQHKLYKYLFLLIFFVFGSALAQAQPQAYPQRNIRVIIPGAAGDTCDMMLRLIGTKFLEKTGMSFIMDNRVGASGQLGLQLIAQAPTDGYTIGCGQGGNMVIIPLAYKKVAYDSFKDYAPIAMMATNFLALAVHPSAPFSNARDLINYGKKNPGKLAFGTNGEGAFLHFATELFRKEAGFTYHHVPFKTAATIVTDLIGGRIDAVMAAFITVQPHAVSKRVRILGVARETRAPNYPQFPPLNETVPGYTSGGWFGAIAPAGMSKEHIAFLNREMNAAMKMPDIREKAALVGLELHTQPPEYFTQMLKDDFEKWGKLAREINFKPQ
jgi:tripartite-type tricarboxylate transporter receptor subunit TctC